MFNTVLVGELKNYKGNTYGMSAANAAKVRNAMNVKKVFFSVFSSLY